MKSSITKIVTCFVLTAMTGFTANLHGQTEHAARSIQTIVGDQVIVDHQVQQCQGYQSCGCESGSCGGACNDCGIVHQADLGGQFGYGSATDSASGRFVKGVGPDTQGPLGHEARWHNGEQVPWEQFAYGEYIGPHRTPHVPEYRLRVNDQLEFVYLRTREKSLQPYQLYVGDTISITSAIDPSLTQANLVVRSDGMISLSLIGQVSAAGKTIENLQAELNDKYTEFVKNPAIVVQVNRGDTPLQDLVDSVDARAGQGGQARAVTVSPDGTIQLPGIGGVPAIGLTLEEIGREVNARYRLRQGGIEVTPILIQRAARFIYVVGLVNTPGRFELVGPTTVLQSLALAEGIQAGSNLRQAIVFRRDQNWRLTATRVDLNGMFVGRRPQPSDDLWLRDSDIVLIPPKPVQRLSQAINLYFTNTLFGLFPAELGSFDAGSIVSQ